ncbi:polysaccharide deacetylase family protein [Afipia massiliensis]|uniref:Chitooligosaccharide deacetylase n=1 Tax=Afipia massiliensis TaxID=211460 RepID=A0A4U6BQI5_9BRAD|nr:polysaccharide deacetylase family protein [Afipia massiliensis]TKT72789.1 polysaccharide deacetylase family protein [Afipia massiliensis]
MRRTITARRAASILTALSLLTAAASPGTAAAQAADCPGNPDALGTSRTIVVDPKEHPRIGTMQYGVTLPLQDREVVLTFDDGPLPAHTNAILDILAAQCVKATFFLVGRMAKEFPQDARRIHDAGHTIGTHSENHPFQFGKLPPERMAAEIDEGVAHVSAALGDPSQLAPFFRIPGLRRSDAVEAALSNRGIMNWSADFPADDWRKISPAQVAHFALSRLEAKGKGVLLLHDIQARTQAALPVILQQLKERGYRVVHVVPATPDRPKTPTDPAQWVPHWIHGPNVAAKTPGGFVFGAPETPPHDAPRSIRSVWMMQQKPALRTSAIMLQPSPLPLYAKTPHTDISAASRQRSLARLPGSHPVRANEGAFRPLTAPIKTGSRSDAPLGPHIR